MLLTTTQHKPEAVCFCSDAVTELLHTLLLQVHGLELIASENFTSRAVSAAPLLAKCVPVETNALYVIKAVHGLHGASLTQ